MQHDIYSLGVVLLEIGIWRPFIAYDSTDSAVLNRRFEMANTIGLPIGAKNKQILEALAERELPFYMGRKYRDIVLLCLRCSDAGSSAGQSFGLSTDADGIEIGVSYIENVLEKIHEISM
jgi:hypothetical protein